VVVGDAGGSAEDMGPVGAVADIGVPGHALRILEVEDEVGVIVEIHLGNNTNTSQELLLVFSLIVPATTRLELEGNGIGMEELMMNIGILKHLIHHLDILDRPSVSRRRTAGTIPVTE
jgi:hypothetical protein